MSQTDKRAVHAIHAWLMDRFPLAFPKDYDAIHPLKVSILANVIAPMPASTRCCCAGRWPTTPAGTGICWL